VKQAWFLIAVVFISTTSKTNYRYQSELEKEIKN